MRMYCIAVARSLQTNSAIEDSQSIVDCMVGEMSEKLRLGDVSTAAIAVCGCRASSEFVWGFQGRLATAKHLVGDSGISPPIA